MRILPLFPLLLAALMFTGCQRAPRPAGVPTQLSQLSSLVASASWLRQHCNRTDIPADDVLTSKALAIAAQRGWPTDSAFRQQLARQVSERTRALDADTPTVAEKCAVLNRSASEFINYSRQNV